MRKLFAVAMTALLVAAVAAPAAAITRGGTPDGDTHPYVGIMVAKLGTGEDASPAWRCSGALISPTVYVTAGHCTFGADEVEIWFESDLQAIPGRLGYPFSGETSVTGTPHTHPLYVDELFFLYDLGVVVLDTPVEVARYASLPEVGALDQLGRGRNAAQITAVGYGLQGVVPVGRADITRYRADLFVVDRKAAAGINPFGRQFDRNPLSFMTSGDAKHGGTCFGDSGGPLLRGDTILGVTSFGLNANCAGVGGGFRIDGATELGFIGSFLD